ncbi:MAG TPA: hypothetical protein VGG13_01430, partial [Candidatus Saccharimonadales bacterium]
YACPTCSTKLQKRGLTKAGTQRWFCTACRASATKPRTDLRASKVAKEIAQEIGAKYLIDDNAEYCVLSQDIGVQALLFGDYGWNRKEKLVKGVTRVKEWAAVLQYFDEQS